MASGEYLIDMATDRYAVMGNPIAHSKSPLIHAAFAEATGEAIHYDRILVEPGTFPQAVEAFFAQGGKGLNVTVPFKEEARALSRWLSDDASSGGAVNTLYRNAEDLLCGDNTDGTGIVRDIRVNHGGELLDKRVLVLGAGGAVRGILGPLLREGPAEVVIANRTLARAEALLPLFREQARQADGKQEGGAPPARSGIQLRACGFEALAGQQFDWVINGTSASLQGSLPPLPVDLLAGKAWCYDLMYADEITPFCRWAENHGAVRAIDGLGMLVEQAAESFRIWRGVRPATADVISMLRP